MGMGLSEYNTKPPAHPGSRDAGGDFHNGGRYCLNVWERCGYHPGGPGAPVRGQAAAKVSQDP